jgi:hypothetical protein
VLNHPLWDENHVGATRHESLLRDLLQRYSRFFHALELNGFRPWRENNQVLTWSRDIGLPLVAGGDRHGLEPNTILNLSREQSFQGFVHEVRYARSSHVVFMPQYCEPQKLRMLRMTAEVLGKYPESPGRALWTDRVFLRQPGNTPPLPLSALWHGTEQCPKLLKHVVEGLAGTRSGGIQFALRVALGGWASAINSNRRIPSQIDSVSPALMEG